jgi:hypothetical protein
MLLIVNVPFELTLMLLFKKQKSKYHWTDPFRTLFSTFGSSSNDHLKKK